MTTLDAERAGELIAVVVERARELARAQAALAAAMAEFAAVRRILDAERIASIEALGQPARYAPGEFAADEVGLASAGSTWQVQRTAAPTRRVQTHLPGVWEARVAGDVDQEKVRRIDAGLRRLQREDSMHLLDQTAVDVAVCKAPELLGRWVNRLVARLEPDGHDDRSRDAYRERYVCRLLTDSRGTLLDATELGRFPSARLDTALDHRAGTCTKPTCTLPAYRCDADHHTPHPVGATIAANLDPKCRRDYRPKTHAGHTTRRVGDATEWTTRTGHTYYAADDPLPTAEWPPPPSADISWIEKRIELVLREQAA